MISSCCVQRSTRSRRELGLCPTASKSRSAAVQRDTNHQFAGAPRFRQEGTSRSRAPAPLVCVGRQMFFFTYRLQN